MRNREFQIECLVCIETIDDEIEIEVLVDFEYSPEEPQTYWEPGCAAELHIYDAKPTTPMYDGFSIIDFDYLCLDKDGKDNGRYKELESQCWDYLENYD